MRIILLFIFGLFLGPWQALCAEEKASAGMDEAAFSAFLSQLKNPFAVQMPQAAAKTADQAAHAVAPGTARPSLPVPAAVKTQTLPSKEQPSVGLADLKVSGVLWAGPKPQAIVNDRVVAIGDGVQGATLVAIRKGKVEFNVQGKNFIVEVQK